MPKFGTAALDDQDVNDVAAFVQTLQPPNHRGGVGLDYLGPFSEGAIAWIFGLGLLVGAVILIERRRT
jgi:ubiquinol-cytochrome c reductase cytochrome c subunit